MLQSATSVDWPKLVLPVHVQQLWAWLRDTRAAIVRRRNVIFIMILERKRERKIEWQKSSGGLVADIVDVMSYIRSVQ